MTASIQVIIALIALALIAILVRASSRRHSNAEEPAAVRDLKILKLQERPDYLGLHYVELIGQVDDDEIEPVGILLSEPVYEAMKGLETVPALIEWTCVEWLDVPGFEASPVELAGALISRLDAREDERDDGAIRLVSNANAKHALTIFADGWCTFEFAHSWGLGEEFEIGLRHIGEDDMAVDDEWMASDGLAVDPYGDEAGAREFFSRLDASILQALEAFCAHGEMIEVIGTSMDFDVKLMAADAGVFIALYEESFRLFQAMDDALQERPQHAERNTGSNAESESEDLW